MKLKKLTGILSCVIILSVCFTGCGSTAKKGISEEIESTQIVTKSDDKSGEEVESKNSDKTIQQSEIKISQISLGDQHMAAITTAGDLYVWGRGYERQTEYENSEDKYMPSKRMQNIKYVECIGDRTYIISEDNDLYALENGKAEPQKLFQNVREIYASYDSSYSRFYGSGSGYQLRLITMDDILYSWSNYHSNWLADNTSPTKIAENVNKLLGCNSSLGAGGILTNDNKLCSYPYNSELEMNEIGNNIKEAEYIAFHGWILLDNDGTVSINSHPIINNAVKIAYDYGNEILYVLCDDGSLHKIKNMINVFNNINSLVDNIIISNVSDFKFNYHLYVLCKDKKLHKIEYKDEIVDNIISSNVEEFSLTADERLLIKDNNNKLSLYVDNQECLALESIRSFETDPNIKGVDMQRYEWLCAAISLEGDLYVFGSTENYVASFSNGHYEEINESQSMVKPYRVNFSNDWSNYISVNKSDEQSIISENTVNSDTLNSDYENAEKLASDIQRAIVDYEIDNYLLIDDISSRN